MNIKPSAIPRHSIIDLSNDPAAAAASAKSYSTDDASPANQHTYKPTAPPYRKDSSVSAAPSPNQTSLHSQTRPLVPNLRRAAYSIAESVATPSPPAQQTSPSSLLIASPSAAYSTPKNTSSSTYSPAAAVGHDGDYKNSSNAFGKQGSRSEYTAHGKRSFVMGSPACLNATSPSAGAGSGILYKRTTASKRKPTSSLTPRHRHELASSRSKDISTAANPAIGESSGVPGISREAVVGGRNGNSESAVVKHESEGSTMRQVAASVNPDVSMLEVHHTAKESNNIPLQKIASQQYNGTRVEADGQRAWSNFGAEQFRNEAGRSAGATGYQKSEVEASKRDPGSKSLESIYNSAYRPPPPTAIRATVKRIAKRCCPVYEPLVTIRALEAFRPLFFECLDYIENLPPSGVYEDAASLQQAKTSFTELPAQSVIPHEEKSNKQVTSRSSGISQPSSETSQAANGQSSSPNLRSLKDLGQDLRKFSTETFGEYLAMIQLNDLELMQLISEIDTEHRALHSFKVKWEAEHPTPPIASSTDALNNESYRSDEQSQHLRLEDADHRVEYADKAGHKMDNKGGLRSSKSEADGGSEPAVESVLRGDASQDSAGKSENRISKPSGTLTTQNGAAPTNSMDDSQPNVDKGHGDGGGDIDMKMTESSGLCKDESENDGVCIAEGSDKGKNPDGTDGLIKGSVKQTVGVVGEAIVQSKLGGGSGTAQSEDVDGKTPDSTVPARVISAPWPSRMVERLAVLEKKKEHLKSLEKQGRDLCQTLVTEVEGCLARVVAAIDCQLSAESASGTGPS